MEAGFVPLPGGRARARNGGSGAFAVSRFGGIVSRGEGRSEPTVLRQGLQNAPFRYMHAADRTIFRPFCMKKLFLILVLFLAGLVAGVLYLREQEVVIVLSEAQLQERVEELFPLEQQYMVVVTLRLRDPEVKLVEGADRIHYRMHAALSVPGVGDRLSGTGEVSGRLRFDEASRQLFLEDSAVEDVDIEGVPSMYRGAVREAADLVARRQLDRHPVYTVEDDLLDRISGAIVVRDVRVKGGEVHVAFGLAERFWEKITWPGRE